MQKYLGQFGTDRKYIKLKYLIDRSFALFLLFILLPFFVIISLIIFLCINENPLFNSYRSGQYNKKFKLYKFKTMRSINSKINSNKITIRKDKRVYKFGQFLRITKIDELPQIINILKGEMSFIGPRPEDYIFVKKFYLKKHFETLNLKPGLASPGSLFNFVYIEQKINSEEEYINFFLQMKLYLELHYVKKVSFHYDLSLIIRTILIIIFIKFFRKNPKYLSEYKLVKKFFKLIG